ncbi:hypothetical protein [Mucilaginibacter sp.]|nr:hypothetical protein [Mucilaginibacter sp.]
MKTTTLIIVIALFVSILSACAKKSNIQASSMAFSNNPFSAKSMLATAD